MHKSIRNLLSWGSLTILLLQTSGLLALPVKIGDLDEDGVATIYDVVQLIILLQNGTGVSEELFPYVDVDGDGLLNEEDVVELTDIVLGRSSLAELPLSFIRSASPDGGEGGVAVTRETIIRLTLPLSEDSANLISSDDFSPCLAANFWMGVSKYHQTGKE